MSLESGVSGFVLAGGRSSRMGTDKAMLRLGGTPLIAHAVETLRGTCADVHVLSANRELAAFAPLIEDRHPGCGPIGAMEAALGATSAEWNLFLAVDMPFLPGRRIPEWLGSWLAAGRAGTRVCLFRVGGRPQPGFCLLHRTVLPFLSAAIARQSYKLMPVLEAAGAALARAEGWLPETGTWCAEVPGGADEPIQGQVPSQTAGQQTPAERWFCNLNTPEEFAAARVQTGEPLGD